MVFFVGEYFIPGVYSYCPVGFCPEGNCPVTFWASIGAFKKHKKTNSIFTSFFLVALNLFTLRTNFRLFN